MEKQPALCLKVSFLTWLKILQNTAQKIISHIVIIYDAREIKTQHVMIYSMPWVRGGNVPLWKKKTRTTFGRVWGFYRWVQQSYCVVTGQSSTVLPPQSVCRVLLITTCAKHLGALEERCIISSRNMIIISH